MSALSDRVITVTEDDLRRRGEALPHRHRIERLLVVDDAFKCVGLITVKDIEKEQHHPNAAKDDKGRLRRRGRDRDRDAEGLVGPRPVDAGVNPASCGRHRARSFVRERARGRRNHPQAQNYAQVIAGNMATGDGGAALLDAGRMRQGRRHRAGSTCTTCMVAGVGVLQLSAVVDVAEVCNKAGVP